MASDKVDFAEPLFFLNIIGMHPSKNNRFSKIRRLIAILIYATTISLGILELIFNSKGLETYARASDTFIPQCQIVFKMVVLILNQEDMAKLLEDSRKFWDLDRFGTLYKKSLAQTHIFLKRFFLVYGIMITFTCWSFIAVKIIFKSEKPVAISFGESKGLKSPYDELYLLLHSSVTFVSLNLVAGFDGLFFYFIGHAVTELRMVKIAFGCYKLNMNWDEKKRFKATVKHHSHVLDFIAKFNDVCSDMLLIQHLTCLFGICFGLYLMNKDGIPPDIDSAIKYMPYIVTFILQTWTFCFSGNLLITWSLEIPNEIFYNDWTKNFIYETRLGRMISMTRGQRAAKLTLGGFGDLDLESFKLVMKNAFSFFTFMNAMLDKNQQK